MKIKKTLSILACVSLFIAGGCKIKTDYNIDPYATKESVVLIPNPLIKFQNVTEAIVEKIVEITTVIYSTHENKPTTVPTTTKPTQETNPEILRNINKIRCANELDPLEMNDDLILIAQIRAKEASEKWSHERPNGTLVDSLANDMNIEWGVIGENLANHTDASVEKIVDAWMNSETHRKNILNSRFQKCGIAEFENNNITYVSIIFTD